MKKKINYECPKCGYTYKGNDEKQTEHKCKTYSCMCGLVNSPDITDCDNCSRCGSNSDEDGE